MLKNSFKKAQTAAAWSLVVSVSVLLLKYAAYKVTGSVSLYSDALESIVNVIAAGVALYAIRYAGRPPDHSHPFGHTKAEYLSSVLEATLILFAAVEISRAAWIRLQAPTAIVAPGLGIGISLVASALNAGMALLLVRTGKLLRSPALRADGLHVLSDVLTTVGILAGIGLAWWTGWWILDPIIALFVAVNVLRIGWRLIRYSVGGLMDERVPEDRLQRIEGTIRENMDAALEVHDIKTRRAGPTNFVEFHLVVPGRMTVTESHDICDRLESALKEQLPGAMVTIHVEPEWKAKGLGKVARAGSDAATQAAR
jgi:cation diffusion facilitator family transporter